MHIDYYRDLVLRAVKDADRTMLDAIAAQLSASTAALAILRAKDYDGNGVMIDRTVLQVPPAAK